jgi:RND family efflux transporter MFP subunit
MRGPPASPARAPALLAVALALLGCGGEAPAEAGRAPAPVVEVGAVTSGSLAQDFAFLGQVQPAHSAELAAAVAGHVERVTAREGDRVEKGQVLVALDLRKARATLSSLRARSRGIETELAQARRQAERVEKLGFPTVSEPERERFLVAVDTLEAQLATQKAEIDRAAVELLHHTLRAPFAGVVRSRMVDPGAWVGVGQPVLSLVSLEDVEVHVDVSAEIGARLEGGGRAILLAPAGRAEAVIAGLVPALDEKTRTMRVRLLPEERPAWLLAGMQIDVEFAVTLSGDGVMVPRDALVHGAVGTRVIAVRDDQGVPVDVEVLATSGGAALVRGDLSPGERVVTRGNERLRPGQPLSVTDGADGEPESRAGEPSRPR